MKKTLVLISLSSACVLFSCANPNSISSSSLLLSNSSSSSSSTKSLSKAERIDAFLALLETKEGRVNEVDTTAIRTSSYLTNAEPLTMVEKDVSTTIRYTERTVGFVNDQKGNYYVMDSNSDYGTPSAYETQTYHDASLYYRLTNFADTSETDTKKTIAYTKGSEERVLGLGLANEEIDLLATLKSTLTQADTYTDFDFPETLPDKGTASYFYDVQVFETGTNVLQQEVDYEKEITLTNGVVTHLDETLKNDMYAGGKKTNWFSTTIATNYVQGESQAFTGTLLDPKNFK